jgi:hypothetical protein
MRLTLELLGWTFDWSLAQTTEAEDDAASALNGGTLAAYPVGFTAAFEMPDEMPLPMRNNGWGDEGNRL